MYEEKAIIVCFFGICFLHLDNLLKKSYYNEKDNVVDEYCNTGDCLSCSLRTRHRKMMAPLQD